MKSKLILACAMVAILLSLCACSSKQVSVKATCSDFMKLYPECVISKEVKVAVDGSLTVTLCSSPTTGFQWPETTEISDQTVLQQIEHKFVPTEPEPPPPAETPGQDIWTFKTLKEGKSTVSIEYSQPWEGGEKAARKFTLTVTVK